MIPGSTLYKNEILTLEENVFDHEFDMSMEDSIISETDKKSSSSCLWGGKGIPGKSARALIVLQDSAEQRVKKKKKKYNTEKLEDYQKGLSSNSSNERKNIELNKEACQIRFGVFGQ